jgi:NADP-dependent 3-hydroxy acid dehydrogenase YdfG
VPVIFAEPSTASVFRDELPNLYSEDPGGQRLTARSLLFSEFLEERGLDLPRLSGKAVYHGHCHQKAVLNDQAAKKILAGMGLEIQEPELGCCGLAGAFGLEKGHYRVSQAIGEERLLPAVRQAGINTHIIADGFSCRSQIMEGTGRRPLHLAELIEKTLNLQKEEEMKEKKKVISLAEMKRRWEQGKERLLAAREKHPSLAEKTSPAPREVVMITGASAGVGRATAQAFAHRGARIGLLARDPERLEKTKQEVEQLGGEAMILCADVADAEQVESAAEQVEKAFGPIDIWVNNAMASVFAPFKEVTPEEFKRVTEVTYLGVVYGTMAALKRMLPRNRGTIVQVGSALAERSIPLQAAYCGAKHGIRGFTDSIRSELLHDGSNVHLTMVQLPALNTPQFEWVRSRLPRRAQPVPPIYQPEVAAAAIVRATEQKKREVYVGISTTKAIWGNKFIPGLLDRKLARMGYEGQQTDEPEDPNRPENLFTPVPGDFSAHGAFDAQSRRTATDLWLAEHRAPVGLGVLAAGLLGAGAYLLARRAGEEEKKPHRRPLSRYHQRQQTVAQPAPVGATAR